MKICKKILSLMLAILIVTGVFSVATPVVASAVNVNSGNTQTEINDSVQSEGENASSDDVYILSEDETRRTENTKHFLMSDGTRRAIAYNTAVHYMKNGKWHDIDNTLVADEKTGELTNSENSFKATFGESADSEKLFSIESEGYTLSWSYHGNFLRQKLSKAKKGNLGENENEFSKYVKNVNANVTYSQFEEDSDLNYTVTADGVKEDIILNKKTGKNKFKFEVEAESLSLILNDDGSISAQNDAGTEIFNIPAPYMYDSNNNYSYDVHYEINAISKGRYYITIVADKEFLKSEATSYPVVIDPAVNTRRESSAITSTFVASGEPATNFNGRQDLYIGTESSNYLKCRSLFKMSLPELNPGDMVVEAGLRIYLHSTSFYASTVPQQEIDAHLITSTWSESSVTWNNQPTYESASLDYSYITRETGVVKNFDITKAVKGWYEGTSTNFGILIKKAVESGDNATMCARGIFHSDNANSQTSLYPVIEILYLNNKGIEGMWSYTSYSAGGISTAAINDYSGNLVLSVPLFSFINERTNFELSAVYNSYCAGERCAAGKDGSVRATVGSGFRLSAMQTILPSSKYGLTGTSAQTYPYVYADGDGTEHYIQKTTEDGKTVYKDEEGLGYTLTLNPTDAGITATYKLTEKSGYAMYFNSAGNLGVIADPDGNKVTISYYTVAEGAPSEKSQIKRITDGLGRYYDFTYYKLSNGNNNNYVQKITDKAGGIISFDVSNHRLNSVSYPDGSSVMLSYKTETDYTDYIHKVTDNGNYSVVFDYTTAVSGKRVFRVREYGKDDVAGSRTTFDRTKYNTTIVRSQGINGIHNEINASYGDDDIVTTLQFDNYGKTISQQVSYGNGTEVGAGTYEYTDENNGSKNKLSTTATLNKNTENLFNNGNAEISSNGVDADYWWARGTTSGVTGNISVSSEQAYTGNKSLMLQNTAISSSGYTYCGQTVNNVAVNKYYTFSAYVKVTEFTKKNNISLGAYLKIFARDNANSDIKSAKSPVITGVTDGAVNKGWRRISATIQVPENATKLVSYVYLGDAIGKAYFDCMQLEKSSSANSVNLLENSSFEVYNTSSYMPTGWTATGSFAASVSGTTITNGSTAAYAKDGGRCLRITGDPSQSKGIYQLIPVQGNPSDTYIVSGWATGGSVNSRYHSTGSGENETPTALFEIAVRVTYKKSDGTTVTQYKESAKFNTAVSGWRYASSAFPLAYKGGESGETYTPTHIMVMPRFNKQKNNAYFDHIQLIKDVASTYKYDTKGNLISTAANAEQKYTQEFDDFDNLISYKDAGGYETTLTYAGEGASNPRRLLKEKSPRGVETRYGYDSYGNINAVDLYDTDGTYRIHTESAYTSDGEFLLSSTDEIGNISQFRYNEASGVKIKDISPNGLETIYNYSNNYTVNTDVTRKNTKVAYGYESTTRKLNKITFSSTVSSDKETYEFSYDAYGNKESVKVGTQPLCVNVYRQYNGLLDKTIYATSDKTSTEHDTVSYTYNNLGLVTGVNHKPANQSSVLKFANSYSANGTQRAHKDGYTKLRYEYGYDSIGRLVKTDITDYSNNNAYVGSIVYGYNTRGHLTSITNDIGGRAYKQAWSYSAISDLAYSDLYAKDALPTRYKALGVNTNYSYDKLNRITKRTVDLTRDIVNGYTYHTVNGNQTTVLDMENVNGKVFNYSYDNMGNITAVKLNNAAYRDYTYDTLGQLTQEKRTNGTAVVTTSYTYDDLGNILSQTGAKNISYTYGNGGKTGWNKLLTSVTVNGAVQNITYDNIGNPTSYRGKSATWFGRQLQSYNGISFTYDAGGLRSQKTTTAGTTEYQYVGDKLYYESRPDGTELYFFYDSYGNLANIYYHKGTTHTAYHIVTNIFGDVIEIRSFDGITKVAEYEYDAWGNCISITDCDGSGMASINPIRYRGYYYDSETGLYYVSSRYYDPEIGRFINADDAEYLGADGSLLSYNLFAYCLNNPVNRVDVNGNFSVSALLKGLGNVATGVAAIAIGAGVIACGVAAPIMLGVAVVTVAAGILTTVNGASDIGEAFTGKNVIKDVVFQGSSKAYNTYSSITASIAAIGTAICGGWMAKNAPRIKAYNNIQNYEYTKTISDTAHMKRPYNNSVLMQKQIIKYGKMTKDPFGYVFSAKGSVNGRTALWRLGISTKKNLVWHFGHGF